MNCVDKDTLLITNGGTRNAGLFSYVGQVVGNLHVADLQQRAMFVRINQSPYFDPSKGNNCWEYYFEQTLNENIEQNLDSLLSANIDYEDRNFFMNPEKF